ncbi:MAG: hypothetical protein AAF628_13930 [Planctomycetota bacterium]
MQNRHIFWSSLALSGLVFTAAAQDSPAAPISVMRGASGLAQVDGALRGVGPDYRAQFDRDAVSYTPALGSAASRTYPFELRFAHARRGKAILASAVPTDVHRVDRTAYYDRAPGARERWDVRTEGLELGYEFATPPAGTGDLVVRLRLQTDLVLASRVDETTGAFYHAEGIGGVRVGGVTGIDARGRRVAGALRAHADSLELVLPSAFVDTATYPLLLDPLIGTDWVVAGTSFDEGNPDVAYEVTDDHYLFVWQHHFSSSDVSVRGQLVDELGNLVGGPLVIRDNTNVALEPTVAAANGADRFIVAWQEGASIFGPWDIMAASVDAATGAVSPAATVAATSANEVRPDASGDRRGGQPWGFVTWEVDGAGIRVAKVDATGPGAPILDSTVSLSSAGQKPAITKSGGEAGFHCVVWDVPLVGIRAAAFDRDLVVPQTDHPVVTLASVPGGAAVDGTGSEFLVVWDQLEPSTTIGLRDIYCQKLLFDGATFSNGAGPTAVSAEQNRDERDPAVGFLQFKWAVAWGDAQAPGDPSLAYDIAVLMLDLTTCAPCGYEWTVAGTGLLFDGNVEIGAARAGGGSGGDKAMIALMSGERAPPFNTEVRAQLIEAVGAGGGATTQGGECGVPAASSLNGKLALGNSSFAFTLNGAEPGVTTALFALGAEGSTFPCGGCQALIPMVSVPVPVTNGSAVLPVPLGCNLSLVGGRFAFQWWTVGTSASPCSLLPTVSFTDLRVGTVGL